MSEARATNKRQQMSPPATNVQGKSAPEWKSSKSNGRWIPAFLKCLADGLPVNAAAVQAGVNRVECYRRRDRDPAFREAWQQAIDAGIARLERKALDIAEEGDGAMLRWWLAIRRPDEYAQRSRVEVSARVDVRHSLDGAAVELLEELRRRVQAVPEPPTLEGEAEEVEGETGGASLEEVRAGLLANVAKEGDEGEDGG